MLQLSHPSRSDKKFFKLAEILFGKMKKSTSKKTSIARDRLETLQTRVIVERDSISSVSETLIIRLQSFFLN